MAIINTFTSVTPDEIALGGTAQVTLGLAAIPGLLARPADLVIVIDSAEGIEADLLEDEKEGVRQMVRRITSATGGIPSGTILGGTRMGLVVMDRGTAVTASPLTDDGARLEGAINAVHQAAGTANLSAGVAHAVEVLNAGTNANRAIVFCSFHADSQGGSPDAAFEAARDKGIQIFGLGPGKGYPELVRWASKPSSYYVSSTIGGIGIREVFAAAADRMTRPSTDGAVISSQVSPDFEIMGVVSQSIGTAAVQGSNTLRWDIGSIGTAARETGTLVYEVRHIADRAGVKPVTTYIRCGDAAQNRLTLEDPELLVRAGGDMGGAVYPEPCPAVNDFRVDSCRDAVQVEAAPVELSSLGRIVQVDVTIKNVCPGKQVAAAVLLSEVDAQGAEQPRGTKTMLIPPQEGEGCRDVTLKCIHFVVPEALDLSGSSASICGARSFTARVLANYVDTDYVACCDPQAVIL